MVASGTLAVSAQEHHELLDVLAAGDGAAARDLMARHVGHSFGSWAGKPER
jgi:DNA-binding GntR family transcriptional regulator